MSFTTEKKDFTASKDILMNLQIEMLLHSDPGLREEQKICMYRYCISPSIVSRIMNFLEF
jgi:hypothetical protein